MVVRCVKMGWCGGREGSPPLAFPRVRSAEERKPRRAEAVLRDPTGDECRAEAVFSDLPTSSVRYAWKPSLCPCGFTVIFR